MNPFKTNPYTSWLAVGGLFIFVGVGLLTQNFGATSIVTGALIIIGVGAAGIENSVKN